MIPDDVRRAITGRPAIGQWEPIFPFLTIDDAGYPHTCLLGRSELAADDVRLYAVVASQTTQQNLQRSGRATLIVIGAQAATYCKLTADAAPTVHGHLLGVSLNVVSTKQDTVGVPLHPATFQATHELAAHEHWAQCATILARLTATKC